MQNPTAFTVAGVDGCRGGWCVAMAVQKETMSPRGRRPRLTLLNLFVVDDFAAVISTTQHCEMVCVDIPIGLSNGPQPRRCDRQARKLLGRPRAASVFFVPPRQCLAADDYETASQICLRQGGRKLSTQSFALLKKIRQVDRLMTPFLQKRLRETHPELCFRALNGNQPVKYNKKTVAGCQLRLKLLQTVIANVPKVLARTPPSGWAVDDALDAIVAAWAAAQMLAGRARSLPEDPPLDARKLAMEIVCPLPPRRSGAAHDPNGPADCPRHHRRDTATKSLPTKRYVEGLGP